MYQIVLFQSPSKLFSMKKAVGIWVRVSTDMQGDSPEHHLERAKFVAENLKDWEVRTVYKLEAVSGKSVVQLPQFKQMLADIKRGYITGLIFSKLARLARNTKELLEIADFFKDHNADLYSIEENLDTSSPAGRFFYTLIAAMAQWEREEIASRVAASVPVRARMGKPLGGAAPYGYKWENKILVLDEEEAPVRKLMYELFAKTKRKKAVAKALNDMGYSTRGGKPFSDTSIDRLLRDPMAKGIRRANYTKSRGDKKQWDLKPTKDWILLECPAIVSEELWSECNVFLEQQGKKRKRVGKTPSYLLSGYVSCACGKTMYVYHRSPSYTCPTCRTKILITDLDEIYHSQLKDFFYIEGDATTYREQIETEITQKATLFQHTEKEATQLEEKMQTLVAMRVNKELEPDDFTRHYQPLKERFDKLEKQVAELHAEIEGLKKQADSSEMIVDRAKDLYARWPELPFEDKRTIIEAITQQIVIGNEEITIKLAHLPSPHTPSLQNSPKEQHTLMGYSNLSIESCLENRWSI
jgi:site-specific DNA recombinase